MRLTPEQRAVEIALARRTVRLGLNGDNIDMENALLDTADELTAARRTIDMLELLLQYTRDEIGNMELADRAVYQWFGNWQNCLEWLAFVGFDMSPNPMKPLPVELTPDTSNGGKATMLRVKGASGGCANLGDWLAVTGLDTICLINNSVMQVVLRNAFRPVDCQITKKELKITPFDEEREDTDGSN